MSIRVPGIFVRFRATRHPCYGFFLHCARAALRAIRQRSLGYGKVIRNGAPGLAGLSTGKSCLRGVTFQQGGAALELQPGERSGRGRSPE